SLRALRVARSDLHVGQDRARRAARLRSRGSTWCRGPAGCANAVERRTRECAAIRERPRHRDHRVTGTQATVTLGPAPSRDTYEHWPRRRSTLVEWVGLISVMLSSRRA